mgnify:FL=1
MCTWPAARAAARAVRVEAAHGWSNAACRPVPSWKPGLPLPARSVISPLGATRRTVCEPESVMKVTPSLVLTIPWGSTSAEMLPRPSRMPGSPLPTIVLTAPYDTNEAHEAPSAGTASGFTYITLTFRSRRLSESLTSKLPSAAMPRPVGPLKSADEHGPSAKPAAPDCPATCTIGSRGCGMIPAAGGGGSPPHDASSCSTLGRLARGSAAGARLGPAPSLGKATAPFSSFFSFFSFFSSGSLRRFSFLSFSSSSSFFSGRSPPRRVLILCSMVSNRPKPAAGLATATLRQLARRLVAEGTLRRRHVNSFSSLFT